MTKVDNLSTAASDSLSSENQLKDTWPRFFAHWIAATLGFYLSHLLPVLKLWMDPKVPIDYPRWYVPILFGLAVCLINGTINSNMPTKPREILKSMGIGFAIDWVGILAKIKSL